MPITLLPIPFPPSADRDQFGSDLGREVRGVHPGKLSTQEFTQIEEALYKAFDTTSEVYGLGDNTTEAAKKSIIQLSSIPGLPQVKVIGHGTVKDHQGIPVELVLKHVQHTQFHKTHLSAEDEAKGVTRFYRWHMDAALYDQYPPIVTALYSLLAPEGPPQTCRYDDGSGDELVLPLGATAFLSGRTMFEILPRAWKSVAVRCMVRYAPHPWVWMTHARARSNGLGLESDGLELPLDELPAWEESKVLLLPAVWKNLVTGALHLEINACAVQALHIAPLPAAVERKDALYPDGARLTDLQEVRELLHTMQRPGIAPHRIYPHNWREKDLVLFHNRGLMHSIVGKFAKAQVRLLHQCNLAGSSKPAGPSAEDVERWA